MKRSNKILSLVLALVMTITVFTIVPLSVSAAETNANDKGPLDSSESSPAFQYRILDDGTAEITSCDNATGNIVIPSEINGYTVSSIGIGAFYDESGINSVRLPETITNISSSAFANCTGLSRMIIPASVTSIGTSAFAGCKGISCMRVEEANNVYDSRCESNAIIETATNTLIAGCKATVIPNSVTSIGSSAFINSTDLRVINIPDSVTNIDPYAFAGCTSLESIKIPASVICIGKYAFGGCDSLTNLTVDPANPVFDSRDNCNAIIDTDVNSLLIGCRNSTIPDTVTSIAPSAFQFCSGLNNITIPDSVTSIGKLAFAECTGLENIVIPNSVTSINDYAFQYCTNLQSVSIGNSVQSIGESAFEGCTDLSHLVIGNYVKTIGDYAFYDCTSLNSVFIPASVNSIGNYAIGYYYNPSQGYTPMDGFTINGYNGSAAQQYAADNGLTFIEMPING